MSELKVGEILEAGGTPMSAPAAAMGTTTMTGTVTVFIGKAPRVSGRLNPMLHQSSLFFQAAGSLIGAFLTPAAVLALSFGLWRLSADLGWTANFPIERGPFSHWMVWIPAAIGLQLTGSLMNRPLVPDASADPQTKQTSEVSR